MDAVNVGEWYRPQVSSHFCWRDKGLRHEFEDELSHVAWGADFGLVGVSVETTVFLSTPSDRKAI